MPGDEDICKLATLNTAPPRSGENTHHEGHKLVAQSEVFLISTSPRTCEAERDRPTHRFVTLPAPSPPDPATADFWLVRGGASDIVSCSMLEYK